MPRKLTITYDRGDALFELVEETEHGGIETSHCAYPSAVMLLNEFIRPGEGATNVKSVGLVTQAAGLLMDGGLTTITLEAP